jgi:hypothetical protein
MQLLISAAVVAVIIYTCLPYALLMLRLIGALDKPDCSWDDLAGLAHLPPPPTVGSIAFIRGQVVAHGLRTSSGRRVFLANDDRTLMVAVVDSRRLRAGFYDRADLQLEAVRTSTWTSALRCEVISFELRASPSAIESAIRRLASTGFTVSDRR